MGNEASSPNNGQRESNFQPENFVSEDQYYQESTLSDADDSSPARYTSYTKSPISYVDEDIDCEVTPVTESIIRENQPVVGYLLHKSQILGKKQLPRFHEVENPYLVYDWEETPKYIFISHRYLSIAHADDNFQTKLKIIQLILKQMRQVSYIWIDFSCIPNDEAHRVGAFMNLFNVITNAQRVLIVPLRTISPSKAPTFDLKGYSTRAWCALEYSIILARHPSKIRIARMMDLNQGSDYKVQFISLPTHDKTIGVDYLVNGMYRLRKILEEDNQRLFMNLYQSTADSDRDIIWDLLKMQQRDIFDLAGMRRNSDFFVRTKFASKFSAKNDEKLIQIYDSKTVREMNEGPCSAGPLNCIVAVCGVSHK
mmetsp:Transcript_1789/g.2429  ORF Transcript_1789/g.2429 Transcript_1789/m.2429 type:complete len:368 (+) Transcript_1789:59-1162(+)|eukprot:CAMPEP_0117760278 /NCGR_PEP_ID=MMETSP0947-20121206/16529_1 /TAXON_ID=44440 /ORGANISM="Chattonella subsalsa, Strain CCMP2191" /LENGTH=367 /DNA_ID=CAMNT_0005580927 /DNA_START=23 /DNA_END=1126 /DNA_ORIENTATION=+